MSYVIALDIGGTKIEGALVSKSGAISHTKKVYVYEGDSKAKILNNISYIVQFLKHITSYNIDAIGVSIAGIVDTYGNILRPGQNMACLKNFNIKQFIESKVKIKTIVENDANCFALAEAVYGTYSKNKTIVGLIWGTGIGSGIVVNKQIISGMGGAGEIGKIKVPVFVDDDKKHHYTLEHLCGGKYIEKAYLETHNEKLLPSKILTLKDKHSIKLNKIVISSFSWGIANIINILNPEVIVVGGGVSNVPKKIYSQIIKELEKYCDKELIKKTKIVKYSLRNDAGLLGAAYLASKI